MSLDLNKPYGHVCGVHGVARYEQDGNLYDAQHNLLDSDGNPLVKAPKANKTPDVGAGNAPAKVTAPKKARTSKAKGAKEESPAKDENTGNDDKSGNTLDPDAQLEANLKG